MKQIDLLKMKAKDILLKFDEPNRYETPSDFDYKELKNQIFEITEWEMPYFERGQRNRFDKV